LECWDRDTKEYVAIKIIRSIKKYRDAAMIEIDVLQKLVKSDKGRTRCVQMKNWFDYRNHICIVSIPTKLIDFHHRSNASLIFNWFYVQ
jgi:dual-specificity kinase